MILSSSVCHPQKWPPGPPKREKTDTKCLPAAAAAFAKFQSPRVCFCWWAVRDSGAREKERKARSSHPVGLPAANSLNKKQILPPHGGSARTFPVSGAELAAEGRSSSAEPCLCCGKLQTIRSDILEEFHEGVDVHPSEGGPAEIVPPSGRLSSPHKQDMAASGRRLFEEGGG